MEARQGSRGLSAGRAARSVGSAGLRPALTVRQPMREAYPAVRGCSTPKAGWKPALRLECGDWSPLFRRRGAERARASLGVRRVLPKAPTSRRTPYAPRGAGAANALTRDTARSIGRAESGLRGSRRAARGRFHVDRSRFRVDRRRFHEDRHRFHVDRGRFRVDRRRFPGVNGHFPMFLDTSPVFGRVSPASADHSPEESAGFVGESALDHGEMPFDHGESLPKHGEVSTDHGEVDTGETVAAKIHGESEIIHGETAIARGKPVATHGRCPAIRQWCSEMRQSRARARWKFGHTLQKAGVLPFGRQHSRWTGRGQICFLPPKPSHEIYSGPGPGHHQFARHHL